MGRLDGGLMLSGFLKWIKRVIGIFNRDSVKGKLGVDVSISREMSQSIELWARMYAGKSPWLSERVKSMNLPAAVASEMAKLTTIELHSEISGSTRADFLNTAYQTVINNIRTYTEYACAKSGLIFKPYVSNGNICISYVQADCFFPTAFDSSGKITGAIFAEQIRRGDKFYTRLEHHDLREVYTVKNRAFVSDSASELGREIPLASVEGWEELQEEITIQNVKKPLFGYLKMPFANTVDARSPLGMSVYAKAVGLIEEADKQYSRLLWEFESGERALYVSDTAFKRDKNGKPILPDKRLYRLLALESQSEDLFKDWTPTLREENILGGLNALLRKIEFNCGLAYGTLSDAQDTDKTAEEIKASKQRSYATVCDIQKALKTAIEDLVYAMDVLCTLYRLAPKGNYDISFEFDDSIVADRKAEFTEKQMLVTSGIMKAWEFRMWYFGESEEEAKRAVAQELDELRIEDA